MLLLIDGGDEMWGSGTRYERWSFPRILPDVADLPEHVYIVLLSRPGEHMLGFHGKTPLLRYVFGQADVDRAIRQHLNEQARYWQQRLGTNEASELLCDEQLQAHICRASEGAFGYVTLLLRQWLPHWDRGSAQASAEHPIEHHIVQLRRWRQQPGSLPAGLYGLRAREFMNMRQPRKGQDGNEAPDDPGLAKALALLTQLRWPLSRHELIALLYPDTLPGEEPPGATALRQRLRQGGSWLAGNDGNVEHEPMRFGHMSLREVALAAWRLQAWNVTCNEETLAEEARAIAGERERSEFDNGFACGDDLDEDEGPAEPEEKIRQRQLQDNRRRADAALHAMLAGASRPEREPTWLAHAKHWAVKPEVGPEDHLDTAHAYDWVWGPLHALVAGAGVANKDKRAGQRWRELADHALNALIDAGYLQSAVRAQATYARERKEPPSVEALRETFIAADAVPGEDPERRLRHRAESALLRWHEHIAGGRLQVGVMLWNLLGADEQGKVHAQRWKSSLDRPAIVASWPGKLSDLDRQIAAEASAITPCGKWLVTSDGHSKTEVWDLRQGWHRAVVRWRLDWVLGGKFEAAAQGHEIGVGGVDSQRRNNLMIGIVDLNTGRDALARYAGHRSAVTSISMRCLRTGASTIWALASGSEDSTVSILVREGGEIRADAQRSNARYAILNPGVMARYAGHSSWVHSVSLHVQREGGRIVLALASGSMDRTVGLLLRERGQVDDDARRSGAEHEAPNPGVLLRYAGHRSSAYCVSLRSRREGTRTIWVVASGSTDGTVGVLLRESEQIEEDARRQSSANGGPIPHMLARYAGHTGAVTSVSVNVHLDGEKTEWALASGSVDHTVGLLIRQRDQIEDDARCSGAKTPAPNPGALARYAGHQGEVMSVSLRCQRDGEQMVWALASGSADRTVGLLLRNRRQIEEDQGHSRSEHKPPNSGVLARYTGHRNVAREALINAFRDRCLADGGP